MVPRAARTPRTRAAGRDRVHVPRRRRNGWGASDVGRSRAPHAIDGVGHRGSCAAGRARADRLSARVPAFFGCLTAGVIAVPSYPPRAGRHGEAQADRTIDRLRGIVKDAAPAVIIASPPLVHRSPAMAAAMPELAGAAWLSTEAAGDGTRPLPEVASSAIALLQYTSGSTSAPRGVMVTHANLLHNLGYAHALARHRRGSASISWLPVNHDMGLIQGVLQPAFSGFPAWLMSPAAFLQRPARWLQAISRVGATVSGAPNFAYDLCVRRV
ncbi:MAG: hypothetical protein DMF85_18715 [Acidobacteria bacterium]|nr:MAG: hypothetical protein DMF85_18715 [Acidobacteriota bacterium]